MNNSGNNNSSNENPHDTGGNGQAGEPTFSAQGPQRLSDVPEDAAAGAGSNSEMAKALEEARAEAGKFKNEYLYLRAEFENYKKQVIKERSDLRKYGSERLIVELLSVLDILDTALASEVTPESLANFRKGIEMTASEFRNTLQRNGVEELAAKGQPFDPNTHEALSSEETNEVPPGTITKVYKKPYKLHDRVIRHGQVIVAKPKA